MDLDAPCSSLTSISEAAWTLFWPCCFFLKHFQQPTLPACWLPHISILLKCFRCKLLSFIIFLIQLNNFINAVIIVSVKIFIYRNIFVQVWILVRESSFHWIHFPIFKIKRKKLDLCVQIISLWANFRLARCNLFSTFSIFSCTYFFQIVVIYFIFKYFDGFQ